MTTEEEFLKNFMKWQEKAIKKANYPTRRKVIRELKHLVKEYEYAKVTLSGVSDYILPKKDFTFAILNSM